MLWIDHVTLVSEQQFNVAQIKKQGITCNEYYGRSVAPFYKATNFYLDFQHLEFVHMNKEQQKSSNLDNFIIANYAQTKQQGLYRIALALTGASLQAFVQELEQEKYIKYCKAVPMERPLMHNSSFGLLAVQAPWQQYRIVLQLQSNVQIEIAIMQYDKGALDEFQGMMEPNNREQGIMGFKQIELHVDKWERLEPFMGLLNKLGKCSQNNKEIKVQLNQAQCILFYKGTKAASIDLLCNQRSHANAHIPLMDECEIDTVYESNSDMESIQKERLIYEATIVVPWTSYLTFNYFLAFVAVVVVLYMICRPMIHE